MILGDLGADGPYRNRTGYDVVASAMGGLVGITGEPDGPPVKVGVAITDVCTGLSAHGAICAALYAREKPVKANTSIARRQGTASSLRESGLPEPQCRRRAAWTQMHGYGRGTLLFQKASGPKKPAQPRLFWSMLKCRPHRTRLGIRMVFAPRA
jgi:hypothetical protein